MMRKEFSEIVMEDEYPITLSSIGMEIVGKLVKNGSGNYDAFLQESVPIWDGYSCGYEGVSYRGKSFNFDPEELWNTEGLEDRLKEVDSSLVRLQSGCNDSDEAGYIVAVYPETYVGEIAWSEVRLGVWKSNYGFNLASGYLAWNPEDGHGRWHVSNFAKWSILYFMDDNWQLPNIIMSVDIDKVVMEGWAYPERDQ